MQFFLRTKWRHSENGEQRGERRGREGKGEGRDREEEVIEHKTKQTKPNEQKQTTKNILKKDTIPLFYICKSFVCVPSGDIVIGIL
jgi:hypothetical protein